MLLRVGMLALFALGSAQAITYTFTNVFPNDGHVVGDPLKFALQAVIIDVSSTQVKVTVKMNYDNPNLTPFVLFAGHNYSMPVADFFFTSAAGTPLYGVAIESHGGDSNGFNTGNTVSNTNLYAINSVANGVLKSDQVMNKQAGDSLTFNSGINVWLRDNGAGSITPVGGASVTPVSTPLATVGNGTTTALYAIAFTINRPASAADPFNQLINGAFGFQAESADCANDFFSGTVPEPATLSFMGLGLAALSLKSRAVRSACRRLLRSRCR